MSARQTGHPVVTTTPGRYVPLIINDQEIVSLCDTGADHTVVRRDILAADVHLLPVGRPVKLANNEQCTGMKGRAYVQIQLGPFKQRTCVYVADNLCEPCLLGADILTASRAVIDISNAGMMVCGERLHMTSKRGQGDVAQQWSRMGAVTIARTIVVPANSEIIMPANVAMLGCSRSSEPGHSLCCGVSQVAHMRLTGIIEGDSEFQNKAELCVARLAVTVSEDTVPVRLSNPSDTPVTIYQGTKIADFETVDESAFSDAADADTEFCPDRAVAHLEEPSRSQFLALLVKHREVFTGLGRTHVAEHTIPTGDHRPIFQGPRPVPAHLSGEVQSQIADLVAKGVLEPVADSEWASPLVLVKRPNGGQIRICGDFRRLNKITTPSVQVIPRMDTCLQKLSGAVYFTSLDLKSAYHQLPVAEHDKVKTTVATEFGLFRYTTAPYGIQGIPHSFNRALRLVLADVPPETVIQYFDDVMVPAKTLEEMQTNLDKVLSALKRSGLTVSLKKLQLCRREVSFLGFKVSASGVQCDEEKVRLIQEWPVPTNAKQVRVFLGLCGYLRRHIRGYAELSKPLTKLTEKHRPFRWGPEEQAAFKHLKEALSSPPVLALPVFSEEAPPFVLDVDASGTAVGGCLTQGGRVIAFASRMLTKSERQYSVTKRELLAVVWATQHFRQFLVGRRFILRTDHAALQWLFNFKDPEGQLARWLLQLSELEFDILHRKGTLHSDGDALSRYPHQQTAEEELYRWVCIPVREVSDPPKSGEQETQGRAAASPESAQEPIQLCAVVDGQAATCGTVGLSMADFCREQDRDESIRELKAWKTRKVRPEAKHLNATSAHQLLREWNRLVVKGQDKAVLYRRVQPQRNEPACLQIVVPKHLRRETLEMCHQGLGEDIKAPQSSKTKFEDASTGRVSKLT